ncbi:MAG: glycosyltransferase family 4 protein [Cyanosarcina radialis HA8281-LM2]|nr:glycosyltransferase family 4 protein [Cyanosarcina radialis HA8281-LM2]
MKIAIDVTGYSPSRKDGINRYSFEILQEFLKRPLEDLVVYTSTSEITPTPDRRIQAIANSMLSANNFKGNLSRFIWHQLPLSVNLKRENASILYSTVPEGMLFPVCPQIITVYDVLPILFPEVYPRLRYYFQRILPILIQRSTAIVTISESTKQDIQKYYNVGDKPIYIANPSYRKDIFSLQLDTTVNQFKNTYNLDRFILSVGETRPYKNTRKLIQAFARLNIDALKLVVVGKIGKIDPTLIDLPKELKIADRVIFAGEVDDEELAVLYRRAKAFVFPSLYEGFGIPPLEAMACGCPVVVSKVASLPEVCGDAAYYVNPHDIDDICAGIDRVINDLSLRQKLVDRGLERVKKFDYAKTVDRLLEIIYSIQPDR